MDREDRGERPSGLLRRNMQASVGRGSPSLSDIFQEVDEEVRRERLKQLWDRYGNLMIGVALVFVVAVGGWRGYQWWEGKKAAEAGAAFEAAMTLSDFSKEASSDSILRMRGWNDSVPAPTRDAISSAVSR